MRTTLTTVPAALVCAALTALALSCAACGTQQRSVGAEPGPALQRVDTRGPDPFTPGTVRPAPAPLTRTEQPVPGEPREGDGHGSGAAEVTGDSPGLYAGTAARGSCDVERQTRLLAGDEGRAAAFARAVGVAPAGLDRYLGDLTPVVLRADTAVTSHGYRDRAATTYQAVLQSGTAVLVDARGLPRVRCACGNPLEEAGQVSLAGHPDGAWDGYRPGRVRSVTPAARPLAALVLADPGHGLWLERPTGDDGAHDRTVPAPTARPTGPGEPEEESATPEPSPSSTAPWEYTPPPSQPGETPTEGVEETARQARWPLTGAMARGASGGVKRGAPGERPHP